MNNVETIKLAKLRLAQLRPTAEVFKARWDIGKRQRLEREDPTKTPEYFSYVASLIQIIRKSRSVLQGYHPEEKPGKILRHQVAKRSEHVKRELSKYGFKLHFSVAEDKIVVAVSPARGKKRICLTEPLNTSFVAIDGALLISREIIQQSSQGSIYLARYACLKTMTEKTGTFAEGVDGKLTRCAGLPSAKKHLVDVITKTYARMM